MLELLAELSLPGEERRDMKASKFGEAQKALILKQGEEGIEHPIGTACRISAGGCTTHVHNDVI